METKKHNILVLGIAAAITLGISYVQWKKHYTQQIESKVYKVVNGWGYDILVDNKLLIRQESVPVIQTQRTFETKLQAEKTARLVIEKLKAGQPPVLTKFDLEKILPAYDMENGQ